MSQVKKYQSGTTSNGIQATTPSTSNQLAFKINGSDYKLDEQAVRDKFNGIFTSLVQSGEAHERDRDKWIASNEEVLGNMKKAPYDLNSSSGHLYNGTYEGQAPNESLGLNEDGSVARKTVVGNFLARGSKNNAQRVSMINGLLGDSILSSYQQDQETAKNKAKEASDQTLKLGQDNALSAASKLRQSYAESAYGKDFTDDPNLILGNWFNDKKTSPSTRYSALQGYYADKYKQLYNPELDKYKDYLKGKGFDIDDIRNHASSNWDNVNQKFTGKYAKIGDLLNLANPFDTMHNDNIFMDKVAYNKSITPQTGATPGSAPGTAPGTNAPTNLRQEGNLFTDGTHYWQDKDKKALQTGFDTNGNLYDANGVLHTGWYLHGNDPDSKYTGWYAKGKQGTVTDGKNYLNALNQNPSNISRVNELNGQYSQIVGAYDKVLSSDWLKAADAPDDDATYNVWSKQQAAGQGRKQTKDVTAKFQGLNGKANIQAYTSQELNAYGRAQIYHMVTLPNHKQYYGKIQTDALNNVVGMLDPNGKPISDPALTSTLRGIIYDPSAKNDSWSNTTYTGSTGSPAPTGHDGNVFSAFAIAQDNGGGLFPNINKKKLGGILSAQSGGSISSAGLVSGSTGAGKGGQHTATVGDIGKSISDPNYSISGSDKAELAALGLNLGALGTSIFGGGGAGVSAGLGAAGTLTQLGADWSKHGFNWGDLGSAALGLGLDAAAIVPGLGVLADGAKVTKTLAKTARFLVPALTTLGLVHAGGVVADLVSGKKSFTDLNIDDMKALTQGITAVTGGARALTQRVGTAPGTVNSITLKSGKQVTLDEPGLTAIKNAAPDAKESVIKSVVQRITGDDDVDLATKLSLGKQGWNPFKGWSTSTPNTNVVTSSTARVPIDPESIQGNGLLNNYRRWAAGKAGQRDLNLGLPAIDPKYKIGDSGDVYESSPGASGKSSPMTLFGDYWQKPNPAYNSAKNDTGEDLGTTLGLRREGSGNFNSNPAEPTYEYEPGKTATVGDIPDTRRLYGSMFGMRSLDNERSISYNSIRNKMQGLQGTKSTKDQLTKFMSQKFEEGSFSKQIQDQITEAISNKSSKGFVRFKEGGFIPKFQSSGVMSWINKLSNDPTYKSAANKFTDLTNSDNSEYISNPLSDPFGIGKVIAKVQQSDPNAVLGRARAITDMVPSNQGGTGPINTKTPFGISTGGGGHISLPKFNINPVNLSELGRALYTSNLNSQIDTRVERPMLTAPMEIPISVRGNRYAQSVADSQADNIVRDSQQFRSSDGSLQMLGNLEAQRQGASIRMQGAMQNNQALEQSRLMAQQNAMQNVQARTNVANENVQTNARATQAERQAINEKRAMVNQPLLDYWKDQNYKSYIQGQRNRDIDTQIGGLGIENANRNTQQQLSQAMNKVWSDDSIPQDQKMNVYLKYANQAQALQSRMTNSELRLRKNPYDQSVLGLGQDYYTKDLDLSAIYNYVNGKPAVTTQKDGGTVNLQREALKQSALSAREVVKSGNESMKEGLQEETKKQIETMKEINDIIKMALK